MIIGLNAAIKDNYDKKSPSLNTMHAWIGVCSIALFGFNFIWGFLMAMLTIWFPDSKIRRLVALVQVHRIIGSSALAISAGAILTGIMDYKPYGTCFYILSDPTISTKDTDSAENYEYLPDSCKIAHGLGILVVIASMFGIASIVVRASMKKDNASSANASGTSSNAVHVKLNQDDSTIGIEYVHVYGNNNNNNIYCYCHIYII